MSLEPPHRNDFLAFGKPHFGDREIAAVERVLRSGWVGMGPETLAFEAELAAYLGVAHAVSVNSCTSALFLSLLVHGVGPGDEVICPSLTWCSTANAAVYLGATPVFCDVDPETLCVTPDTVCARLSARTKAVMVVHMGGLAADLEALRAALPPGVAIVEDAAHALGADYPGGGRVGSAGNLACFSFYANKNLATGEGGAVALHDGTVAERLRSLRQHGLRSDAWKRYIDPQSAVTPGIDAIGYKMNFIDLLACIGRVQLERQEEFARTRLEIAQRYLDFLREVLPDVGTQSELDSSRHARHLFVIKLPVGKLRRSRDEVVLMLRERNVGAGIHYAPIHRIPAYDAGDTHLPCTEDLSRRILTLPIGATMTVADADYVGQTLASILRA